ncbi:MAG: cation diffusion facilitator family transporter [Clostridiales Family XIII bacterium]|jgi:cation diffusion facilitator family transporter|nr:cation diffusion facilitator family transporter [Clostridiales Family XIII bacterium]
MVEKLIDRFVGGAAGREERERCGRLSGITGTLLNALLGALKLAAGLLTGSIAVMADAVNNLTDAAASVITFVGFSYAAKKSDDEHPFGHARVEYMTGMVVSGIIVLAGWGIITESYEKIVSPGPVAPSPLAAALLVALILVKAWLYRFNLALSRRIGSASLKATAIDARNDVISSAVVLGALLAAPVSSFPVDGVVGLAVGCFVIYSGLSMVKETAAPLLGQNPDRAVVDAIALLVKEEPGALGYHDLIIHDYGPGHVFATIHIEADSRMDVFDSHRMVDNIEQRAQESLGVLLVGHMDPIDTQDLRVAEMRVVIGDALAEVPGVRGFHDLRLVPGARYTRVIFDVVVSHEDPKATFALAKKAAQQALGSRVREQGPYVAVANLDLDYTPRNGVK